MTEEWRCAIRAWRTYRMKLESWIVGAVAYFLLSAVTLSAQLFDANLRGVVRNDRGVALKDASVLATQTETGFAQTATTDSQGQYYFGSLPRGSYVLKVEVTGYLGLEKSGVELAVGAKQEENFTLTPATQQAPGKIPDVLISPEPKLLPVETIASSVSIVVDENKILQLPLANRNIYSLFLLQPGVTSQGAIVERGLTFSIHGQRVSGSNYLLDGIDNNNIVLTGPVAATSAESIQEFRMINSSFSAEYGRATSFVAQVVTRTGSNRFHGNFFEFLANDILNANTFENNSNGIPKDPLRRNQLGFLLGGPLRQNRTFFSGSLESSRFHYGTTQELRLPSSSFIADLPTDSQASRLLTEFPPLPSVPLPDNNQIGTVQYQDKNHIDTLLATARFDHQFNNAKDRLTLRYTTASTNQFSSPGGSYGYPSLEASDHFRGQNGLFGWTRFFVADQVNRFSIGWSQERIELPRPRPDVPILEIFEEDVFLPGNKRLLDHRENNNVIQLSDIFSLRRGRSALNFGGEYRANFSNGVRLGLERDALGATAFFPSGIYFFNTLNDFKMGKPTELLISVDRFKANQPVALQRKYRSTEFALFAQNDLRLSQRLSINVGLRYEYYGVPHSSGSQDVNFYFGSGETIAEQLANGQLRPTDQNPGSLKDLLHRRDFLNLAPSVGLAWDPFGRGNTVLRAGYAVALDRVFDSARDLRSNSQYVAGCVTEAGCPLEFLIPPVQMLPLLQDKETFKIQDVVQLDENLRTPYAQNWYFGVQHSITPNLLVEIGHSGSTGRKLISRDIINRSINGMEPWNPQIGEDTYLSNAGNSNYLAFEAAVRRRFSRGLQYQVSYTYSHAIDNQSDILQGVRTGPRSSDVAIATFTRQFDARLDRGNASFDQRHNLVFNAVWELPQKSSQSDWSSWILKGWMMSVIGAYRSGFPITAINSIQPESDTGLYSNRLDFLGGSARMANPSPVPGGVQWLDPNLFEPASGRVGNLGRGFMRGPGFWNYDFAVIKNFGFSNEKIKLQFRAEFYNLFNHPNLSPPVTLYEAEDFGRAYYGLNPIYTRFGDLPLSSPSRTIQFGLRVQF